MKKKLPKEIKALRCEKIFQGWAEIGDYRVEAQGSGIYGIYRKHDSAYVRCGTVRACSYRSALADYLWAG